MRVLEANFEVAQMLPVEVNLQEELMPVLEVNLGVAQMLVEVVNIQEGLMMVVEVTSLVVLMMEEEEVDLLGGQILKVVDANSLEVEIWKAEEEHWMMEVMVM